VETAKLSSVLTFQPQAAVIASFTAFLRLVVALLRRTTSEELVALESLVEMVMLFMQVAAVPVQGPTALTQEMAEMAEMAEMEFSPTSPALPHFTEAAGVVAAIRVMGVSADRVEAATGTTTSEFLPRHQVQQTQAVVEEEANFHRVRIQVMRGQAAPASSSSATSPPPAVTLAMPLKAVDRSHLRRRRRLLPLRIKRSRLRRPATPCWPTSPTRG
jgi:hypothetical protein